MKKIYTILLSIFGICLLFFGSVSTWYGTNGLIIKYEAASWPNAVAKIISTDVTLSTGGRNGPYYCPKLISEYSVDGNEYNSSQQAFDGSTCSRSSKAANLILEKTPVGSLSTIIYDPNDPSYSAREISNDGGAFWWLLVVSGIVFIFIPVASLIKIISIKKIYENPKQRCQQSDNNLH